jgi:hypothetical protein
MYAGRYIWASFTTKNGKWVEIGGKKYVPNFDNPGKTCQAYAHLSPYKSGQRVFETERTFAVHDGSPNIRELPVLGLMMSGRVRMWAVTAVVGTLSLSLAAASGPHALGSSQSWRDNYDGCGFHPVDDRTIAYRRRISCAAAKRVLRQLKANRLSNTVPMVCGLPRVVRGWR